MELSRDKRESDPLIEIQNEGSIESSKDISSNGPTLVSLFFNSVKNDQVNKHYGSFFFALFVIGCVTNLGYVMVGTAAQDLAHLFDQE